MLKELIVKNFALIEEIHLNFENGFNVITGETGAGKSILIDAINVLLGEKGKEEFIRKGSDKTSITGIFDISEIKSKIEDILTENEISLADNLLIIKRILQQNNNKVYINDEPVTINFLNKITKLLVDIHGQYEHQTLFDINKHLELVDSFANLSDKLELYKNKFDNLKKLKSDFFKKQNDIKELKEKRDLYDYQLKEIGNLELKKDEDIEIENILSKYRKLNKIIELTQNINSIINDDENLIYKLEKIIQYITEISLIDKSFETNINNCNEALILLKDFRENLQNYTESLNLNQTELDKLEHRAYQMQLLKKKYGPSLDDVLNYYNDILTKYNNIEIFETDLIQLENQIKSDTNELQILADEISNIRKKTAETISEKITAELKTLNMNEAEFKIEFSVISPLNEKGKDKVEFLVKTNKGEDFKQLRKIASGGELSRFMLAIKSLFAQLDKIPTMIFDEIDSGISGKTGTALAKQILKLSKHHQVFCITHLPVLAAAAHTHFKIYKEIDNKRTVTKSKLLSNEERVQEIAYLMSGGNVTKTSLAHSKELLKEYDRI